MIKNGRSLNFFLMDGNSDGRIKCTLANWTGVIYKLPRGKMHLSKSRKDLQQSGVYLLISSKNESKPHIYVGQAGLRKNGYGVYKRILEHNIDQSKDFWEDAIVITTFSNDFGPTEISYLEYLFYYLVNKSKRAILENNVEPTIGNVTEEKKSELDEFIKDAILIIETLGYDIFKKQNTKIDNIITSDTNLINQTNLYYLKSKNTKHNFVSEAKMIYLNTGKVKVLRGSKLSPYLKKSMPKSMVNLRSEVLIDNHILKEDVIINSPSTASGFVLGRSSNGWYEWVDEEGNTLNDNIRVRNNGGD